MIYTYENLFYMPLKIRSSYLYLFCTIHLFASCSFNSVNKEGQIQPSNLSNIQEGNWLGKLIIDSANFIPFNFYVSENKVIISNDEERIITHYRKEDTNLYKMDLPVFNSMFVFSLENENLIGYWHNYAKGIDYKMNFIAKFQGEDRSRFEFDNVSFSQIEGEWEVTFGLTDSSKYKALGVFNQENNLLSGTFITETGDYRFLEGAVKKDSLFLSCFDGSHAFLFKANYSDNKLEGDFYSGNHYKEHWEAEKNPNFQLKNPDSITTINDDKIAFAFPNLDSTIVKYPSESYNNKVVIIQIIGSWCPNCMDETAFLTELYNQYHKEGLEVISLAYEKPNSFKDKCKNLSRLIEHTEAKYEFLIAGESSKKDVERTLPFINNVKSFPTCIILDKKGDVIKVHSGFYGPGTGKYYEEYIKEVNEIVKTLLAENINS